MTRKDLLTFGRQFLEENDIADAYTDAWLLFQYVTELSRVAYLMDTDAQVNTDDVQKYKQCIEKRAQHYPLQHITHAQGFMGLDFYVNEHVLVPRQDTEVLVETVLDYLRDGMNVLDMCTGSGCILISLAASRQIDTGLGVDLSEQALNVARLNAGLNKTENLTFIQSDLFENVDEGKLFDIIVSNPPYIPSADILTLMPEVQNHEPRMALDGHDDGLYFYRKIISEARKYLKPDGMVLFEIGWNQAESVCGLFEAAGFCDIQVKKDLAGLDRVVFAQNKLEAKKCLTV